MKAGRERIWSGRPPVDTASTGAEKRKTARSYLIQYAVDLSVAYLLAVIDVAAILVPLRGHLYVNSTDKFTAVAVVLVVLSTIGVAVGGVLLLAPNLRWFIAGKDPTTQQRDAAIRLPVRQSGILLTAWAISGLVMVLLNHGGGA